MADIRVRVGEVLAGEPVAFAYLFGSVARNQHGPESDVDVAVGFDDDLSATERFDQTLRIGVALERVLDRSVDVVDLADAPLRLAGRILTERVVVAGHDRPARIRFETDVFARYVDFEHHASWLDGRALVAMAEGRR